MGFFGAIANLGKKAFGGIKSVIVGVGRGIGNAGKAVGKGVGSVVKFGGRLAEDVLINRPNQIIGTVRDAVNTVGKVSDNVAKTSESIADVFKSPGFMLAAGAAILLIMK
jgi:hypothetical protein